MPGQNQLVHEDPHHLQNDDAYHGRLGEVAAAVAETGEIAIERLRSEAFDLVITDLALGRGASGMDVLRVAKEERAAFTRVDTGLGKIAWRFYRGRWGELPDFDALEESIQGFSGSSGNYRWYIDHYSGGTAEIRLCTNQC